jgi:hypothetical protein
MYRLCYSIDGRDSRRRPGQVLYLFLFEDYLFYFFIHTPFSRFMAPCVFVSHISTFSFYCLPLHSDLYHPAFCLSASLPPQGGSRRQQQRVRRDQRGAGLSLAGADRGQLQSLLLLVRLQSNRLKCCIVYCSI